MRLNKYLAESGVDSRRNCDQLIADGRVSVNGKVMKLMGYIVNEENDSVMFDGHRVTPKRNYYVMLHKPKGYVTTVKDEKDRRTVMELININARLFPVGRLDYDTEGLLLLTNDGDLAYKLTHPSHEVSKTYVAKFEGQISQQELMKLAKGVEIEGVMTAPAKVEFIDCVDNLSRVEVTIREGRNRQVKKMFETVGKEVLFLKRTAIGELRLGGLSRSTYRHLTEKELKYLRSL